MATDPHNLITKHTGTENLGGKGRLTGDLITMLSSYYGWALKFHKENVEATHKPVMATYYHNTSNDEVANYSLCPTGPDFWRWQSAAAARGEPTHEYRHNMPLYVRKVFVPIYERFSERELLEWCQRCKAQNNNKSLHSKIWSLAQKQHHASLFSSHAGQCRQKKGISSSEGAWPEPQPNEQQMDS